jgi:hypothetical protein
VTVSTETPLHQQTHALWRPLFVLVVAAHLAVLYWPRTPSTGGLPVDKVVHAAVFGIVLWVAAKAGLWVWPVAGLLAAHAVVSELIQHYLLAGRSGDPADSVADLVGVVIVTLFLWRRK